MSPSLAALESEAALVYRHLQATPLLRWPLLCQRLGGEIWVKHENHNPTGAFKVRGGLVYLQRLREREPDCPGVITATRGNHGQSVALSAGVVGIPATIVVPCGNSRDKNRAMAALGAELIEYGRDFDEAAEHAGELAQQRGLHRMPSFHRDLVNGVATYSLEMLRARPGLQRVYVPIGLGSGICGLVTAAEALGSAVEIVGVVASGATCYQQSLAAGRCVATDSADTLADGMAVRAPNPDALAMMQGRVARVVTVDDDAVLAAMGWYYRDTHNIAEGAGAAALAAAYAERDHNRDGEVAVVLTGGNVDAGLYRRALATLD